MRVLIIGGGIGGLAVTLALRRRDVPAVAYTAAPGPDEAPDAEATGAKVTDDGRAGLWLPPGAMHILDQLGAAEAVRKAGARLERVVAERSDGTTLCAVDLAAEGPGVPGVALSRHALRAALAERLPAAVLHRGMTCEGFAAQGGQVTARFAGGTEASGEALVGADGAASGVRQQLVPGAMLRGTDQVRYEGTAELSVSALPGGGHAVREVWGDGARFGHLPLGPAEDGTYWFATQRAADVPVSARAPAAMKQALTRRFADLPASATPLIEATPPEKIARGELRDLAPFEQWHRGRVALLGDAAHAATPNLGLGAAQALRDAYVLAVALEEHGTPEAAFSKYEEQRRESAHRVVRRARQAGQWAHARGAWARLRDGALRLVPAMLAERPLRQLFSERV
jgi:2-polyprenyl-6-methoxyphenol hydroxylase-like FAD-dependent oxidoreductase